MPQRSTILQIGTFEASNRELPTLKGIFKLWGCHPALLTCVIQTWEKCRQRWHDNIRRHLRDGQCSTIMAVNCRVISVGHQASPWRCRDCQHANAAAPGMHCFLCLVGLITGNFIFLCINYEKKIGHRWVTWELSSSCAFEPVRWARPVLLSQWGLNSVKLASDPRRPSSCELELLILFDQVHC